MSTITIKNVPPAVHQTLKERARAHGRSLNREIIYTIENALHGARIDAATIGNHARTVREAMDVYVTQRELSASKNAGRR